MIEPSLDLSQDPISERAIYHEYERKRRLRLAGTLLPIFAVLQCIVVIVGSYVTIAIYPGAPVVLQVNIFTTIVMGFCAFFYILGVSFARRGHVSRAVLCLLLPMGATIIVPPLAYDVAYHLAPHAASPIIAITFSIMMATMIFIVLTGILTTGRPPLIGATLSMNILTAIILVYIFHVQGLGAELSKQAVPLIPFVLVIQWAIAGVLLAASGTYLQTLRELGDVRIAYARAQQLDELKDQFITHINHELRTPVMAMQGHVELLLLTEDGLSREERTAYLERAKRAGDNLVSLVTGILDMRRLEQGAEAFAPAPVPLREALDAATQMLDPREMQTGGIRDLRVTIAPELAVWGETVRVRQIFTNLLSNAIKYSPPGTPIEVAAHQIVESLPGAGPWWRDQRPRREMVEIIVRDYGLGIPPAQIPLLFKRFVRLPRDLASSTTGNGLGLHLCKAFAEDMGGSIRVESSGIEGEGAIFRVLLPVPLASLSTEHLHDTP
ncbi:MAG: hypothetical protein OJF49_001584 [Ktedonobacterales bacterium]|jgi:signal transduction histidine kinase|nr:MAG: hypothetical protein OJF49_001584 [Ktedonobacterales bacterium]